MALDLTQQEQLDRWLHNHGELYGCPACGSNQRRVDVHRSPRQGDPRNSLLDPTLPPTRIEITCLACARVRVFDAGVMGLGYFYPARSC